MKVVILKNNIENDSILLNSFKEDCIIIKESEYPTKNDLLNKIKNYTITNLCFIYHNPGYSKLPFYNDENYSINNLEPPKLIINKYKYFSNNIIDIINNITPNITIDLLTCNLNNEDFKKEVEQIESDLNINIRYSIDQTGNNSLNTNWILESDNIDVKNLYFNDNINNWNVILTGDITNSLNSIYITITNPNAAGGKTYTLTQNCNLSDIITSGTIDGTEYINLGPNDIFDGNNFSIDLDNNTITGLFATSGTSISSCSIVRNLGLLNGETDTNAGFFIKEQQSYFFVEKCYSTGNITGDYSGGIAGMSSGAYEECKIKQCYSTGDISGTSAGGIAGSSFGYNTSKPCTIEESYSIGNIIGNYSGGIVGSSAGHTGMAYILNCFSTGTQSTNSNSGGIAGGSSGMSGGKCIILNCYSTSMINNTTEGLIGQYPSYSGGRTFIFNSYSNQNLFHFSSSYSFVQDKIYTNTNLNDTLNSSNYLVYDKNISFISTQGLQEIYQQLNTTNQMQNNSLTISEESDFLIDVRKWDTTNIWNIPTAADTYQYPTLKTNPYYCLCENTEILTPSGYIPIENLKINDYVITSDNKEKQIKNIYYSLKNCIFDENLYPIIIPKDSIDINYPSKECKLSRYHAIKYNENWIMPFKNLNKFKIDKSKDIVKYYHIQLENYKTDNLIINNGLIVESLGNGSNEDTNEWANREKNSIKL